MTTNERRNKRMVIRLTAEEKKQLQTLAAHAEITPTDYARTRALDTSLAASGTRAPSVDRAALASALGTLGGIGDALQDIRLQYSVGDRPIPAQLEHVLSRLIAASEGILRALGVQP